eukprot:Hpha_TRINITY_DN30866_c0_g1::TRINITY_DN30866_c0_g1_i1::g.155613::m.155613/K13717/OTUD3; OTU domain-containing protein 3
MDLEVKDVPGDGNCLFAAVSDQVVGSWDKAREYRARCVAYMEANREDFEHFLAWDDEEDWDTYIGSMAREGEWGGALELLGLSRALGVDIIVHEAGQARRELRTGGGKVLHLGYHLQEHYTSLRYTGADPSRFAQRWASAAGPSPAATAPVTEELRPLVGLVTQECPWMEDREGEVAAWLVEYDYDCEAVVARAVAERETLAEAPPAEESPAPAPDSPPAPAGPLSKEQKKAEKRNKRAEKEMLRAQKRRDKAAEMRAACGDDKDEAAPSGAVISM